MNYLKICLIITALLSLEAVQASYFKRLHTKITGKIGSVVQSIKDTRHALYNTTYHELDGTYPAVTIHTNYKLIPQVNGGSLAPLRGHCEQIVPTGSNKEKLQWKLSTNIMKHRALKKKRWAYFTLNVTPDRKLPMQITLYPKKDKTKLTCVVGTGNPGFADREEVQWFTESDKFLVQIPPASPSRFYQIWLAAQGLLFGKPVLAVTDLCNKPAQSL